MDQRLRECVGEGPPPFDEEQHQETAIYTADRLSVYICQHGVDFTSGAISHSNYEFFLPLGKTIPLLKVEMQKRPAQYQHLFPFNPEQPHGCLLYTSSSRIVGGSPQVSYACDG